MYAISRALHKKREIQIWLFILSHIRSVLDLYWILKVALFKVLKSELKICFPQSRASRMIRIWVTFICCMNIYTNEIYI